MRYWSKLLRPLMALLAPGACPLCGTGRYTDSFCATCKPPLLPEPLVIAGIPVYSAARFPSIAQPIRRLKYASAPHLAAPLAELLLPHCASHGLGPGMTLTPVPLHPRRLAQRGYNQATLIARHLANQTGSVVAPRGLVRTRDTAHQVGQGRKARLCNVERAMRVRSLPSVGRFILVDDVVTTGATLSACIEALLQSGRTVAAAFTVARADP